MYFSRRQTGKVDPGRRSCEAGWSARRIRRVVQALLQVQSSISIPPVSRSRRRVRRSEDRAAEKGGRPCGGDCVFDRRTTSKGLTKCEPSIGGASLRSFCHFQVRRGAKV